MNQHLKHITAHTRPWGSISSTACRWRTRLHRRHRVKIVAIRKSPTNIYHSASTTRPGVTPAPAMRSMMYGPSTWKRWTTRISSRQSRIRAKQRISHNVKGPLAMWASITRCSTRLCSCGGWRCWDGRSLCSLPRRIRSGFIGISYFPALKNRNGS